MNTLGTNLQQADQLMDELSFSPSHLPPAEPTTLIESLAVGLAMETYAARTTSLSPVGAAMPQTINVLLIDDQAITGKVIQRLLASEADITLHHCHDPRQALQVAIKQPPTVIMLDLVMQGIDGLVVLRWLRQHSATHEVPVVMLSAKEDPEMKAQAFAQGANDYLIKPPDAPELIARIRYHARSYHNFQGMVAATQLAQSQSRRLEQTLKILRKTQAQLIQAEKLAGLEQLVAGMAHEINNPINFIYGNLKHAQNYTDQLLRCMQFYQQTCSPSCSETEGQSASLPDAEDLEFMIEDLPKILESMRVGADRIRQIILSLRNFSHLDQAKLKAVDIHEGIESTLLLLQHRLKPESTHLEIHIIKDYGALPAIECYPAQLNQVFMNLLSNAIDAIEERRQKDGEAYTGQVRIHTALKPGDRSTVIMTITDNGCGITESVQPRIFDPFFTTKPVGKGTGLGLSSSYQTIVTQHHGSMKCTSLPGQSTEFRIEIPLCQNLSLA